MTVEMLIASSDIRARRLSVYGTGVSAIFAATVRFQPS
ncbi:hypothetical protein BKA02_002416 [Microbacterium pseudoresistens]|uniref:Uncharacterized protein n=1 Tax=Microbacterium pseudoresistens TaxID=640634 RepID=A0A7Y9EX38_9MICO|nr:hypothetical protein [Microbacterium pseudoresistens]